MAESSGSHNQASDHAIDRFYVLFERSTKRWERIVYPAMGLVLLLTAVGFYQVQSLSRDMRLIAGNLDPKMAQNMMLLTQSIQTMAVNVGQMSKNIDSMSSEIASMSKDTHEIVVKMENLDAMRVQMTQMNGSINAMTMHTDMMRWNIRSMDRNVSKPMGMMNSFMPW